MLKKLFKYEWKASSRLLLAVYGIVILFLHTVPGYLWR